MSSSLSLKLSLNKKSRTFLTTLYNHLHNPPSPDTQSPKITTQTVKFTPNSAKSLIYMSSQIRAQLTKLTKQSTLTTSNITIILYTTAKTSKTTTNTILKKLFHTTHVVKSLVKNTNPTSITVYLTPAKKTIPDTYLKPLGPNEINSGSTFVIPRPDKNGSITIWRKEELMRVTIHELLHSLKADFHLFTTPYLNQKAHEMYNLPNDNNININEAYNELNACLFTAALSAPTVQKFFTNIEYERLHSIKLAARVMQYQNTLNSLPPHTSPDWLFHPYVITKTTKTTKPVPTFHQNTNVFSYYIAKTALLYNLNNYISFITTTVPTYPLFPPTTQKLDKYFTILASSLVKFRPLLTKMTETLEYPPKMAKDRSLKMTITGSW